MGTNAQRWVSASRLNLNAGQTVTAFNGKPVKGTWSAEFLGDATDLPPAIPFKVTWARP